MFEQEFFLGDEWSVETFKDVYHNTWCGSKHKKILY